VPINITSITIDPKVPAANHTVKVTWNAQAPSCFSLERFVISGVVTFANRQTRAFQARATGNQNTISLNVAGGIDRGFTPREVAATVAGFAKAPTRGQATLPASLSLTPSCPLIMGLEVTQAIFDGLQPAPTRPGQDFFPKVKVSWRADNLPPCFAISEFELTVELRSGGKSHQKKITVPGNQRSAVVVVDSIAVGSSFVPDQISARTIGTGTARIEGSAKKEVQIN
jgi:hypothetical protein